MTTKKQPNQTGQIVTAQAAQAAQTKQRAAKTAQAQAKRAAEAKRASQASGGNGNGSGPGVQDLVIKIDVDALTFGDIEMALQFEEGVTPVREVLPFLNRVVVGGVKNIPLTAMPQIMDALIEAFEGLGNQKN